MRDGEETVGGDQKTALRANVNDKCGMTRMP
jgi:hypothetical protein